MIGGHIKNKDKDDGKTENPTNNRMADTTRDGNVKKERTYLGMVVKIGMKITEAKMEKCMAGFL